VSGQIPVNPADGTIPEGIEAQTRQSLDNIGAILKEAGMDYGNVVKTDVFMQDLGQFAQMNAVYAQYFPSTKPARVCCQVAALPKGVLVEIDAIAVADRPSD
jgi:2-iminobutanoate/2-iminopropanoate deaminase